MNKKIFISHRSLDKGIADVLDSFLTNCGIPSDYIFCSSLPGSDVEKEISKEIKACMQTSLLNIVILSSEYYKSPYCQNEAGIIWFLDVPKIVIACPEINEALMEGFLDDEHKLRRLDIKADILSIADIIKDVFPEFNVTHTKLSANCDRLINQYKAELQNRRISPQLNANSDNPLEAKIANKSFSESEMCILQYFYITQKQTVGLDFLEITTWLNSNNIAGIDLNSAVSLLAEDSIMEYVLNTEHEPTEIKLTISAYRDLRKLSASAVKTLADSCEKHIYKNTEAQKSSNEIDNLIAKGFTDEEILLIKYIMDLQRGNLYFGWQTEQETSMISNWEDINEMKPYLSSRYNDAVQKFDIRKFIEPCAKTSYGNTKEYRIRDIFLGLLQSLNDQSMRKIESVIQSKKKDDRLPF